jgi:hypothetical protein
MTIRTTLSAIVTVASITAAHAGVNSCEGTVHVGTEWTTVIGEFGNYAPNGCRFLTASKLGRRILTACPDGSQCMIDVSLPELIEGSDAPGKPARQINAITNVERIKP